MPKVEKTKANLSQCVCDDCPSYNDCAQVKKELLYCAEEVGKSACDYKMNGCICGGCPVHKEFKLKGMYFCLNGAAK